jgi:putative endonuclease
MPTPAIRFDKPIEIRCPKRVEGQYFMYLLACHDGSLYCGSTKNVPQRFKQHRAGEAAQWTKKRLPAKLVYYETYQTLQLARQRERQIKGWTVRKKLNLITGKWKKQK